jgi:hypothetical protein
LFIFLFLKSVSWKHKVCAKKGRGATHRGRTLRL